MSSKDAQGRDFNRGGKTMHAFMLLAVGFVIGAIFTGIFGAAIAADAKNDTEALLNGVETRIHAKLDALKASTATAVDKGIAKL
jgi:hypothetical protein